MSLQENDCRERDISQLKFNLIKLYKIKSKKISQEECGTPDETKEEIDGSKLVSMTNS
jgi:hypothetical protein